MLLEANHEALLAGGHSGKGFTDMRAFLGQVLSTHLIQTQESCYL